MQSEQTAKKTQKRLRTLFVKSTTFEEIEKQWGFKPMLTQKKGLYVRCTKDGIVNWNISPIYYAHELLNKIKVTIILSNKLCKTIITTSH